MKIIVPTRDNNVDPHFVHCAQYTVFSINDKKAVETTEVIPSMPDCDGGRLAIIEEFEKIGATVVLAKNMNENMAQLLKEHNFSVYRGCSGKAEDIIEEYLKGKITDNANCGIKHKHHGSCSAIGKPTVHEDNHSSR